MEHADLLAALRQLGELLRHRGQHFELAVIGGGALLLLGLVQRATRDLDAVALVDGSALRDANPLPDALAEAVVDVAEQLGLDTHWLNGAPSSLIDLGLPEGFAVRTHPQDFGGLRLLIADRYDQIHFKLYAAVDQGPRSKHFADLLHLDPTRSELEAAATWSRQHDPSPAFAGQLRQARSALAERLGHGHV